MPSVIVIILIIFAIINSSSKKKNKAAKTAHDQTVASIKAGNEQIRESLRTAVSGAAARGPVGAYASDVVKRASAGVAPVPDGMAVGEGASLTDDEGCIGGSMPHPAEHEGTSYTDDAGCVGGSIGHGEHTSDTLYAAFRNQNAGGTAPDSAAQAARRGPDAADMRRAVVMSEILSRPVSLR